MIANRSPDGVRTTAASASAPLAGRPRPSRNTASMSAAEALPPAPCARVTSSSRSLGRRWRKASMRSSTRRLAARRHRRLAARGLVLPSLGARHPRGHHGAHPLLGWGPCDRYVVVARDVQELLDAAPQGETQRGLRLLDPVDAARSDHQQVVEVGRRPHLTPVVAGEADREETPAACLRESPKKVHGISAGRETQQDISLGAKGDHLPRKDELEAHVVGERGDHGMVRHERPRGQGPPVGWLGEQGGQRVGVRGASAVAHGEQPAAGVEPVGDP